MKITGGILKDQIIKEGKNSNGRFIDDGFREELFNFIPKENIIKQKVLDIAANNGILGLEALSRGAEFCDFVEKDPDLAQIIRENLSLCGFLSLGRVYALPEEEFLRKLLSRYGLIFYNSANQVLNLYFVEKLVDQLLPKGLLIVIYTYSVILPLKIKRANIIQTYQLGEIKISFYKKES